MAVRMKKLLFPAFALAAALLTPTPLQAHDSPLAKQMEALNDAFKSFRRETDSTKGAAGAREAQDAILKAIPLVPARVEKIGDSKEKAKALSSYRKQMAQMYVTLCEIEAAFIEGDTARVNELLEAMKSHKKQGHDAFMEDED